MVLDIGLDAICIAFFLMLYISKTTYGRFLSRDSLEFWYYRILILMTGNLEDAKTAVDSLSIWYEKYIHLLLLV